MSAGITSRMYLKPSHCSCSEFYYADICLPSIVLQELCTSCSRVAFNQSLYTVPVVVAPTQTVLCTYPLLTSLDAVSVDPWVCTLVRVFQVSISFRSNRLLECFTQVLNFILSCVVHALNHFLKPTPFMFT